MIAKSGVEIDSLLLKVFINMVGVYPMGTLLLLDTREVVMVHNTPAESDSGRPLAFILEKEDNALRKGSLVDLGLKNPDGRFTRNILHCFHPTEFGLAPTDILL
jgi:hypothetical protein